MPTTNSPVVLFHYPCNEPTGFEYLGRLVKMEFGSLTDQRPVGTHALRPWVADEFPKQFEDFHCEVVALGAGADLLGKGHYSARRASSRSDEAMRDRFSRHYSDMAALARSAIADGALVNEGLRQRVTDWKSRFFAANWARYDLAKPGTFHLVPPEFRLAELERDYRAMRHVSGRATAV